MTYIHAALTILAHTDRPLTVPELTAVAVAQGLVRPRGKTPDRTMASVLYRRMAADPDAPIISREGRFWLRGRPLPAEEASYLERRARRTRRSQHHAATPSRPSAARRPSVLPPPPLLLPAEALEALTVERPERDFAPVRREKAVARAGARGARLLERLATQRASEGPWTLERTEARLVAPLLRHLGYRAGGDIVAAAKGRGVYSHMLLSAGTPLMALDVRPLAHDLGDDDAWRALTRARLAGAPYAAVTNGRQVYLYAVAIAEARDAAAAALVLSLDLTPAADEEGCAAQAAALWLLSRRAVADAALDAYATSRAVGAALLQALDAPDSPLATALLREVRARAGLAVPASLILRHARLALRGRRGRDGEPLTEEIAAVAAVRGPRLDLDAPAIPIAYSA